MWLSKEAFEKNEQKEWTPTFQNEQIAVIDDWTVDQMNYLAFPGLFLFYFLDPTHYFFKKLLNCCCSCFCL